MLAPVWDIRCSSCVKVVSGVVGHPKSSDPTEAKCSGRWDDVLPDTDCSAIGCGLAVQSCRHIHEVGERGCLHFPHHPSAMHFYSDLGEAKLECYLLVELTP